MPVRPAVATVSVAGLTPSSLAASSPAHPQGKWRVVPSPDVGDGQYLADVSALSPTDAWAVGEYWEAPPNRRILTLVIERFSGGPVGLSALAHSLGEDKGTLEDLYEPFLLQSGFLQRTPKGRVASALAYRHLGLKPMAGPGTLFG